MIKKNLLIVFICLIVISSCKKSDRDLDNTTNTSVDVAFATNLFYDIFKTVHQAAYYSQGIVTSTSIDSNAVYGCDSIYIDTLSNPKKLDIIFNANCTTNGIIRNGTIKTTLNGNYNNSGTSTTVSFSNYSYNGFSISSGTLVFQYLGLIDSFPTFSVNFNDLKIANSSNQKIFFNGSNQLQIIKGKLTPTIADDVYSISGSNNGIAFKGNTFSSQITTNLTLAGNCNWIGAGIVAVKPDNLPTRTLNFGSGCDDKIDVTIYDNKYELVIQ